MQTYKSKNVDFTPNERIDLDLGRELKRRKKALRGAWLRLMAMVFAKSPKRYMQLAGEARKIVNKEVQRICEREHPTSKQKAGRAPSHRVKVRRVKV